MSVFVDAVCVVKDIAFHSVNHLNRTAFFRLLLRLRRAVRECLNHAVVGNRNRRLSPLRRLCHDVLCFVEAVHLAHLRVDVKFYTLAVFPGILAADFPVRFFKVFEHNRIHVLKGIPLHLATDFNRISRLQQGVYFAPLGFGHKRLRADRRLVIGNQKRHEMISVLNQAL